MNPAVRIPASAKLRPAVELKLKPGWNFDAAQRAFVSDDGQVFAPRGELPAHTRIVHKTPALVSTKRGREKQRSDAERELLRYVQIILPAESSAHEQIKTVRKWPCVAEVNLPPEPSLPGDASIPNPPA